MGDGGRLRRLFAAVETRVAVCRRHDGRARVHVPGGLGDGARGGAAARRARRAAPRADSRAARHARRLPRGHLGQLSARPAPGAVSLRHRPPGDRPGRRLLPELLHHRGDAGRVRGSVALLRAHGRRQGVRGGGDPPARRRADGNQPAARHRAFVRGRRGRRGACRAARLPQHLGALPHGRAARHSGLHRAGDRRGGAGRRRAARRPSARLCGTADRALRPHPVGVHAGRAARFSHDLPAGAPHRFAESEGMSYARWIGAFVILAALPFFMGSYYNDVYRKTLLAVTLALSYNFLFGICGQVAFSHFAFYGLGAYGVVILLFQVGLSLPIALLLALLICVILALIVAIPATRLEGFYLALVTLALAQLFIVLLNEGGTVTGGAGGIANYRLPPIFGTRISGPAYTLVIVALLAGTFAVLWRLDRSWFGRACRAVRDNPEAAAAMGVDVARTKVIVFTLTSALAGVAGMVYAFVDNTVNPPIFGLENAFLILFMVIVGGAGRHAGAVIGAILLFLLPFWLSPLVGHHHQLVFGALVVAAILLQPKGLIGLWDRFSR